MNKKFNSPPSACIDCWRLSHKECPEGYTEPSKTRIACKNHIKDNNQGTIQCHDCMRNYLGNCPETSDTQCEVIRGNIECKSYYKRNTKQMDEQQKDIQENKGVKYDGDKVKMALVLGGFANALIDVGKVGTFGAKKYADDNWKGLENGKKRCLDAALRHIFQYLSGEEIDEEMQLPHLAAGIWELLAAYEFYLKEKREI